MAKVDAKKGPELAQYYSDSTGEGRRYKHPLTGEYVPSVTTVTGMEDKSGGLVQWAVDLSIKWAADNALSLLNRSDQQVFNWGRYRHTDVKNERALIGTEAHQWIESDLLEEWELPDLGEEATEIIHQWLDLKAHHNVVPKHVEATVWSHKDKWAGTLDLDCDLDGVRSLIDNKTSKGLYDSHKMQLAALASADCLMVKSEDGTWSEEELPKFEQYGFFHLRPTYWDPLKDVYIPAFWEVVMLDPDEIPVLYDAFLGYRRAWEAKQNLKVLRKEKESLAKVSVEW